MFSTYILIQSQNLDNKSVNWIEIFLLIYIHDNVDMRIEWNISIKFKN